MNKKKKTVEYLQIKDIAEKFNISERAVRKWIDEKGLKYFMRRVIGKKQVKVVSTSDLEKFVKNKLKVGIRKVRRVRGGK